MTFIYPAVFSPKKDGKGYHVEFPDLACCEADGPDLEDALENASDAAYNWIWSELEEEEDCEIPAASPMDELEQKLKILLLPKDPNDDKNVIVEIRDRKSTRLNPVTNLPGSRMPSSA